MTVCACVFASLSVCMFVSACVSVCVCPLAYLHVGMSLSLSVCLLVCLRLSVRHFISFSPTTSSPPSSFSLMWLLVSTWAYQRNTAALPLSCHPSPSVTACLEPRSTAGPPLPADAQAFWPTTWPNISSVLELRRRILSRKHAARLQIRPEIGLISCVGRRR